MAFVKLTSVKRLGGHEVTVNSDRISRLVRTTEGTAIWFAKDDVTVVQESSERILSAIEAAVSRSKLR